MFVAFLDVCIPKEKKLQQKKKNKQKHKHTEVRLCLHF